MQAITEWFLTNPIMIVIFAGVTGFFDDYSSFLIAKKKDPDHKTDYEPKQAFRRVLRALIAGGVIALPGMAQASQPLMPELKPLTYQDEAITLFEPSVAGVWFPDTKADVVYPTTVHREDDLFGLRWLDMRLVAFAGIDREFDQPFAGGAAAFGGYVTNTISLWAGPALKWQDTHRPDAIGLYGEVRYSIKF